MRVCTKCKGNSKYIGKKDCPICNNTGRVTFWQWIAAHEVEEINENREEEYLVAENAKLKELLRKLFDDWNNRGNDTTDIDQYLAWMELEEMLR